MKNRQMNVEIISVRDNILDKTSGCRNKFELLHLRWLMQHDSVVTRMAQAEELKMTPMLQAGQTYSQWTKLKTEIWHNFEYCLIMSP